MFVGNDKVDTLIHECTQKKLSKVTTFFIWVYLSDANYEEIKGCKLKMLNNRFIKKEKF